MVGVYQVNVLVPQFANVNANAPVTISYSGMTSNAPTIAVK
jgi:uncharacterized protein (TIGR03437 family)